MSNWLHRLFNPHCPECSAEREFNRICDSCESKNREIAHLMSENERLLNHILNPTPKEIGVQVSNEEIKPIMPSNIPWRVRKQMLEEEDRAKARAMANAPKPDLKVVTKENEKLEEVLLDTSIPTVVALTAEGSD